MINKVIKRNKENTPHLKGTLTIELNHVNTCFIFQQVLYFALIWIGILLVHSTFFLPKCSIPGKVMVMCIKTHCYCSKQPNLHTHINNTTELSTANQSKVRLKNWVSDWRSGKLQTLYTAGSFRSFFNNKPAFHNLSIIYRIEPLPYNC